MKNRIGLLTFLFFLIMGCQKENAFEYSTGSFIQFQKSITDSITVSFALCASNVTNLEIPIGLEIKGLPKSVNTLFDLELDPNFTTARPEHYMLTEHFTFRPEVWKDSCLIRLNRTTDLKDRPVRLVLRLKENDEFKIGELEHTVAVIWVNDLLSKPDWWDNENNQGVKACDYLGEYSDKKFKLFIEVVGNGDMSNIKAGLYYTYAIQFKYWLAKEKAEGRTVYEENGTEMTVAVLG